MYMCTSCNVLGYYMTSTHIFSQKKNHSTREIQSATAMPSISEVIWIAVLFNVVLLLLFISASTPATAM